LLNVRQYKAKKVIYDVKMYTAGASQAIRDAYGLFWRKKSGKCLPPELKGISFTNATTFSTRVRLRVLKELCRRHQLSNPNLSCYVTNYLARPELKIRDRRGMVTSLTYIQAVQQLPHHFTLSFLHDLYQYARTNLPEREVIERFLILTPDLLLGASPEQLLMSMDVQPSAQNGVQLASGQIPNANVQNNQVSQGPLAPVTPTLPSLSLPPPPIQGGATAYMTGAPIQSHFVPVQPSITLQSNFPAANTVSYASVTAMPQVVSGEQVSLFTSTPGPNTTTPGQPDQDRGSPTYATLTTVQVTPPSLATGSFLPQTAETTNDSSLSKRNRHRFLAQKSAPYPAPN
jgi:hypothetical protein